MNSRGTLILSTALALNVSLTVYLLITGTSNPDESGPAGRDGAGQAARAAAMEQSVGEIRQEMRTLRDTILGAGAVGEEVDASGDDGTGQSDQPESEGIVARIASIEARLGRLQSAMDGISLEDASKERAELFASENGHLKADEYLAAEKYAIAGEGYLTFLEHHPDHPDRRGILERSRDTFSKAGYTDKAIWLQNEMMKLYPEDRAKDLVRLSQMEQFAQRYGDAAKHVEEAASLMDSSDRYWKLLYAAWYTQLADGNEAGLAYTRNVLRQIEEAGYGEQKLGNRAREKIAELEQLIASGK